jgi:hypothetical protein
MDGPMPVAPDSRKLVLLLFLNLCFLSARAHDPNHRNQPLSALFEKNKIFKLDFPKKTT